MESASARGATGAAGPAGTTRGDVVGSPNGCERLDAGVFVNVGTGATGASHPTDATDESDGGLARRDREILAFERQWWKYSGVKEDAIRELFGMSATRYYQVVNALIDNPLALAADPMLVKRLRRMRTDRQRKRSARRLGIEL